MNCTIRQWRPEDAAALAELLNNQKILDNLRDGIATHAVKQACGDIFARTDILRIFAEPFSYNAASCRVLEKAGFQFEGLLRNNAVKKRKDSGYENVRAAEIVVFYSHRALTPSSELIKNRPHPFKRAEFPEPQVFQQVSGFRYIHSQMFRFVAVASYRKDLSSQFAVQFQNRL